VSPEHRDGLESIGLRTARDFLALAGIVVSGHVGRNVSRVDLGGVTAYLKREHRVRLRDRFRSWQEGFSWASLSAREATVLRRLEEYDLPGPKWLAAGECDGAGFLLLEAAESTTELRALRAVGHDLAERLGRIIAKIHAAGVDQPDLFAKHVLVCPQTLAITILDWQRAVLRQRVSWAHRVRGLAALRATASLESVSDAAWTKLVAGYLDESVREIGIGPSPSRFHESIESAAAKMRRRRGVAAQRLATPPVSQELVRIGGERVCAIPEVAHAFESETAIAAIYDRTADGSTILLPGGRRGLLRVRRYALPFARWWQALRGRTWRSPELRAARLLFHLERHGIAAPKLLAYGQTAPPLAPASSFLLSEPTTADAVESGDASAAHELLAQAHQAGCRLSGLGPRGEPFGVSGGRVVIRDVNLIRLAKRLTPRQVHRDRSRLDAFFRGQR
jgi:tRNA A-37 threonylcarbamoyl transferase component Bud32